MKNWKTTLAGLVGGVVVLWANGGLAGFDWGGLGQALATAALGFLAADARK